MKKEAIVYFFTVIAFVFNLSTGAYILGDYQGDYYPDKGLITVESEGRVVYYLPCERIHLDYPELTGRGDVNMDCDTEGNIWAAVAGPSASVMKRLFRSQDGGITWTSVQLPPTQDRNLVAFTVLNNDNLLLATNLDHLEPRIYISLDKGGSWNYTTSLTPGPYQYVGEGFLSLTQLSNGNILFPAARFNDDPYETGIRGGVFISTDGGNSFPTVYPTFDFCMEGHVLELPSGKLLGVFRYQRLRNPGETDEDILEQGGTISPDHDFNFKNVFLGDSHDSGVTWKNLRPLRDHTGRVLIKYGQCHGQLVRVPDGRVVLVYDNRYPNEERDVRARTSKDDGQTWDPETYYLSFGRGNPASVVLDDGTIVTVTGNRHYGPSSATGPPSVQVIRWQLPPYNSIPSIEVLSPASLSQWPTGSQQTISWNSNGGISNVDIDLYQGDSLYAEIASSADNTGTYTWNIPSNITGASDFKIRVSDSSSASVYGESETFSITRASISINKNKLTFGAVANTRSTGSQEFIISNCGTGTLNWSISVSASWLNCSPISGTNAGAVTVSIDTPGLLAGTYTETITVSDPNASNFSQTISVTLNVYNQGSTSPPFGTFETPVHGSGIRSSVPVTGWVLDDIEVESVKIYNGSTYLGDAVFVEGARPDVQQAYPGYPNNYRAGWGYMMLSNFLPNGGNGTYTLYAKAMDIEGNQVILGSKTVTIDNTNAVKPFGALDTPAQGSAVSGGSFINWGWALTPQPNNIPTDGSTINVYVDGVNLGHPVYNIFRADIAGLFPGYANSNGAVGYFYLDTTAYENGVHTIQWTAEDSAGNTDGIGSRYFSVQNTGSDSKSKANTQVVNHTFSQLKKIPIDVSMSLKVKRGFDENIEPAIANPDEKGISTIVIRELGRVEVRLWKKAFKIYGYLKAGNRLYPLPFGSTLETGTGIFYWQPGLGFTGEYEFVFIAGDRVGNEKKKVLKVKIIPKFSR